MLWCGGQWEGLKSAHCAILPQNKSSFISEFWILLPQKTNSLDSKIGYKRHLPIFYLLLSSSCYIWLCCLKKSSLCCRTLASSDTWHQCQAASIKEEAAQRFVAFEGILLCSPLMGSEESEEETSCFLPFLWRINEILLLNKVQLICTNDHLYQGHHAQRRCPSSVNVILLQRTECSFSR